MQNVGELRDTCNRGHELVDELAAAGHRELVAALLAWMDAAQRVAVERFEARLAGHPDGWPPGTLRELHARAKALAAVRELVEAQRCIHCGDRSTLCYDCAVAS